MRIFFYIFHLDEELDPARNFATSWFEKFFSISYSRYTWGSISIEDIDVRIKAIKEQEKGA